MASKGEDVDTGTVADTGNGVDTIEGADAGQSADKGRADRGEGANTGEGADTDEDAFIDEDANTSEYADISEDAYIVVEAVTDEDTAAREYADRGQNANGGEGANIDENENIDESADIDEEGDIDEEAYVDEDADIDEEEEMEDIDGDSSDNISDAAIFKEQHLRVDRHAYVLQIKDRYPMFLHLWWPCATGNADMVRMMVQHGYSVNQRMLPSMNTPLYTAIANNQQGIITLLHSLGADLNLEDTTYTPLMWACHFNEWTVHQLVMLGANVRQINGDGETALHIAVEEENIAAVHMFLQKERDLINMQDDHGEVPLVSCCSYGGSNPELVKLLLEYGADVNIPDYVDEQTPVHLAAAAGNRDVMELLLQANANVNALDIQDLTPLHLAMVNEQQEMIDMLFMAGAQIEVVNADDGETALFFACRYGHMEMFRALIQYTQLQHIYRTNMNNQSCLDLAERFRHEEIASMLRCIIHESTTTRGFFSFGLENVSRSN